MSTPSRASCCTSLCQVVLLLLAFVAPVGAGPLQTEVLQEKEGWRARVEIDCYTPGAVCGRFDFAALGCRGELTYQGEDAGGHVFRERLLAGACTPGCLFWLDADGQQYRETCKGRLSGQGRLALAVAVPSVKQPETTAPVTRALPAGTVPPVLPVRQAAVQAPPVDDPARRLPAPAANAPTIRAGDTTYRGDFRTDPKQGTVSGEGSVEWANGDRFLGRVVAGQRQGYGRFVWASGQSYQGDWRDDQAIGRGQILFADGGRYQGDVQAGLPHGQGSYSIPNGNSYEGSWQNGLRHGPGRLSFASGDYWEGRFENDQQSADGRLILQPSTAAMPLAVSKEATAGGASLSSFKEPTKAPPASSAGTLSAQAGQLSPFELNGRFGYLNAAGQVAIPPDFTEAATFSEGLALVRVGEVLSYIDVSGKPVLAIDFDDAGSFSQGLAPVLSGEQWGYVDREGRLVIKPRFQDADSFAGGYALVKEGGLWAYLEPGGQLRVAPRFAGAGRFSEGLAPAREGKLWGFINDQGRFVIPSRFAGVGQFANGLAPANENGRWGYIGRDGAWLIQPEFEEADMFSGGLAVVKRNGRYGYIDPRGRWVLAAEFDDAGAVEAGLARVVRSGQVKYLDAAGKLRLSVVRAPCGREVLSDAAGILVWPETPDQACP
jgi:hypothetical protein